MPKRYRIELRRDVCKRLLAGASVVALAKETGLSQGTLFRWKKQAFVDADLAPGAKSIEVDELAQAQRTIEELEAELALVRVAAAFFNGEELRRTRSSRRRNSHEDYQFCAGAQHGRCLFLTTGCGVQSTEGRTVRDPVAGF
jgi:transposase-like protein